MKRIDEFEKRLDELIQEFSDIDYQDLAESFEYYAAQCMKKQ